MQHRGRRQAIETGYLADATAPLPGDPPPTPSLSADVLFARNKNDRSPACLSPLLQAT
jgi:hypothetical protein